MVNVTKVCNVCKTEKEIGEFYFRSTGKPRNECKTCTVAAVEKRRKANPEKYKAYRDSFFEKNKHSLRKKQAEYRVKNKEALKIKSKVNYHANSDKINASKEKRRLANRGADLERKRKWYLKNKEKHSIDRANYEAENKDRLRTARRKWENDRLANDLNYSLRKSLCKRIRSALKGVGLRKDAATEELIGCTVDFFKTYIEGLFTEGMSWDNWGMRGWHIDHRIPISWFSLDNENCKKMAFSYKNMQPLWGNINIKKNNKYSDPLFI